MTTVRVLVVLLFISSPAVAQNAQNAPDTPKRAGIGWRDQPSISAGPFRLDVHAKVQADMRRADQDLDDAGGMYQTALKRIGVGGKLTDRIEFEVERELRKQNPWRNVFVNVAISNVLEVRAGKFKMPFGYEELTGIVKLDFAYRTLLSQIISPARDVGVMAHGHFLRRVFNYQLGVFRHDGENARSKEPAFLLPGEEPPKSMTSSDLPEGLNSLRGRSLFGTEFAERMYVMGTRRRLGTEAVWLPGPFSVKTEYARSNEERKRQGIFDDDISDYVTTAWYLSGTWAVTGERKEGNIEPRRPMFQGGFGALELGVRFERTRFASALKQGTPFLNPRADPLLGNAESILTLGVNWYVNKWGRVVVNGMREAFEDPERTAVPGRTNGWAAVTRLQFEM